MFEMKEEGGVFDSWVSRWREYRGIDRWPIVDGTIYGKEHIEGVEDEGYYKLTITYTLPVLDDNYRATCVITLTGDTGSEFADAEMGDRIALRAHPTKPNKAVFAETRQAARRLMATVVFGSFGLALLIFRGCR